MSVATLEISIVMQTIQTSSVPVEQLKALAQFAQNAAGPELRDVLLSVSRCISEGADLAVVEAPSVTLTPAEAAERLGMSRTHLYKLLDRGEVVSHRVGRDRRIRVADLVVFEEQRQSDRRELAERFAKQRPTRDSAIDEVADLL
jgi:excisionase family DNA binding protein